MNRKFKIASILGTKEVSNVVGMSLLTGVSFVVFISMNYFQKEIFMLTRQKLHNSIFACQKLNIIFSLLFAFHL